MDSFRSISRRRFIRRSAGAVAAVGATGTLLTLLSARKQNAGLMMNHVGFTSGSPAKRCLLAANQSTPLQLFDVGTGRLVQRVEMKPVAARDFGEFVMGDFSSLTQAGEYELRGEGITAAKFVVQPKPYSSAIAKSIRYFSKQRCGASGTDYHAPCHLDDGRRADNGRHQNVSGGWHDACDLRKWVDATIYGMFGLIAACESADSIGVPREQIIDELRWGEAYFRKMQEPAGYVMNYCGGDDGNRYTDNKVGSVDDRVIHVEPTALEAQFLFIAVEAALSRLMRAQDGSFADGCLAAAVRCFSWCEKQQPGTATHLAAALFAMCEMHRANQDDRFLHAASRYANDLIALQFVGQSDVVSRGAFRNSRGSDDPSREIHHGNLPPIALCAAAETFEHSPDRSKWVEALRLHATYLQGMAARSAFEIVPFGLYLKSSGGPSRALSERFGYRYFMRTKNEYAWSDTWWVGINAHLGSTGEAAARMSRLLSDQSLVGLAQRQLDWILGCNLFAASTMSGVGHNQPKLFRAEEFSPPTPLIEGGVMNGIGGMADDSPTISSGDWNTCEYWTPMVAYTMRLMCELQR